MVALSHFLLTRSAYGPEWSVEANARRLRVTEGICARMIGLQDDTDFTWAVLLDPRDPLLEDRLRIFETATPGRFQPILWETPGATVQAIAAAAYHAPWAEAIGDRSRGTLVTRVDDDDGLTADYLGMAKRGATGRLARVVLMMPSGIRVWEGRYSRVRHDTNAMHSLFTPPGDDLSIYSYSHRNVARIAPVSIVDEKVGWLWSRHRDTISGWKSADQPLTPRIRKLFPVDFSALQ